MPFPLVALSKSSEGWGCGIPPFAKCAKDGPPSSRKRRESLRLRSGQAMGRPLPWWLSANSRFLTGLCARFGMRRVSWVCGAAEAAPFQIEMVIAALQRRSSMTLHASVLLVGHAAEVVPFPVVPVQIPRGTNLWNPILTAKGAVRMGQPFSWRRW